MCYLFMYQYIYENVNALNFSPGFPHSRTVKSQTLLLPDGLHESLLLGRAVQEDEERMPCAPGYYMVIITPTASLLSLLLNGFWEL